MGIMWGLFFAAVGAAVIFLYLPGFLLLRAARITSLVGVVCAPFVTLVMYGVLSIIYAKVGVFCSWRMLVLPATGMALVFWAASLFFWRAKELVFGYGSSDSEAQGFSIRSLDWLCLGLYVVIGVAVTLIVLVDALDGPNSFVQEFDNVYHLGAVRSFVDAGNWSSLDVSLYPSAAASFNPLAGGEYYPAAWHGIAALLVSFLNAPVTLAANATNVVFTAIVFPSGMFLLMRCLFPSRTRVVALGALCTLAFASFPWGYLTFGPLYSNLSSFAILPAVTFCFISLFAEGSTRRSRVTIGSLFIMGMIGFALTQPNAVFTMGVFLIPFCVHQIIQIADRSFSSHRRSVLAKVGFSTAFLILVAALWIVLFKAPFLQRVVTHSWSAYSGKVQALVDVATLAFNQPAAQIGLGVVVALGVVYTLYHRKFLWLSCSYALMVVIFIVGTTSDNLPKFLLAGFWYTDSYRTAASAAFFAIPLAALGLTMAASALRAALSWAARKQGMRQPCILLSTCVAVVGFIVLVFYPSYEISGVFGVQTAFGSVHDRLAFMNNASCDNIYSPEERAFVQEVKRIVAPDALIINEPNDGSAFAYGVDDLDIYYRHLRSYGGDDESEDSVVIRNGLNQIESDERVRSAVEHIDAQYVLVLDQGDVHAQQPYLFTYSASDWVGINAIDDTTPGFSIVLSRGDMRLYRIEPF